MLLTLLLSLSAATADNRDESGNHFKAWITACQADGYCSATSYEKPSPDDGTAAGFVMRIGRPAQQTYWEVSFTPNGTDADPSKGFAATTGKQTISFSYPDQVAPFGSINDFYFLGTGAQTLLDRLVHGTSVTISFTDRAGQPQQASFSLAGIGAALIWIDGLQGRIGSERVAEVPPYGLYRADVPGAAWMQAALAFFR